MKWLTGSKTVIGISLGVFIGVSIFTFWYAKGYSYMLNDPEVCINCHVMRENYNSWQASSHSTVACNDCHIPHGLVRKYLAKAENGYRHSLVFTFGPPDVIRIRESNRRVLQENCIECHRNLVDHLPMVTDNDHKCVDCHTGVGHGK